MLLDDALSAVDAEVGQALFREVILGKLQSKTVIFVTNALQYLPYADSVVWMEGGRIRAKGTYEELLDTEPGLSMPSLSFSKLKLSHFKTTEFFILVFPMDRILVVSHHDLPCLSDTWTDPCQRLTPGVSFGYLCVCQVSACRV